MSSVAGAEVIVGSGKFRYRVVQNWAKVPAGWEFRDAAAVAVDRKDRVYVFSRGGHPMMVFDRDGNFLSSWGENLFKRPHGLHIGPDENIYCTDDGDHTVRKCTLEGKVLLELGIPGKPAPAMSGEPFHRCTHTALSPKGEIFVSDGYQNARVHKYSPDGKLLKSWGESGTEPGQFNIPHNIVADQDGYLYVADRENHRVQVFNGDGKYQGQWNNLHRPCGLFMESGKDPLCYIGEIPASMKLNRGHASLGAALKIATKDGKVLCRIGEPLPGPNPGQFVAPHGLAADSHGDIYVGEVSYTFWPQINDDPIPPGLRSLHKLVKIA